MTTAADLIRSAREYAGIRRQGETLSGDVLTTSLNTLNAMLDNWRAQRLFAYRIREETFTWGSGNQSRTVGSGGSFSTDRPIHVDHSTAFRSSNIDYPVEVIDVDGWSSIPAKQTQGPIPRYLYPEQGASLLTLYVYPIPSASITLVLRTWQLLQSFATATTELSLAPGYQDAIETSLGERVCIKASKPVPPELREMAKRARAVVKSVNAVTPIMTTELGMSRHYDVNVE